MNRPSRTSWLLILFSGAIACSTTAAEGSESASGSDPNHAIIGTWKGAYFAFPETVAVTLTVRALPLDRIEGECELSPAIEPRFRNSGTHGAYYFTGRYTPWATEFNFTPKKWIDQKTNTMKPMSGVFDLRGDRLVGQVEEMGAGRHVPLVLARQPNGDKLLAEIVASAYAQSRGATDRRAGPAALPPSSQGAASFRVPTSARLVAWASRLKEEKPDLDLRHTYINILYGLAHNLFEDDYFKSYFGATYDRLSREQRDAVAHLFRDPSRREELRDWQFLSAAFRPNGSNSAPDITMSVFWQRAMRSWMKEQVASFAALAANMQSFIALKTFESIGQTNLGILWPSELASFNGAIAEARTRIAVDLLDRGAEAALAAASGVEGARKLADWPDQAEEKEALRFAPSDRKEKIQGRMAARIDELIEQPIAREAQTIAGLGHGFDAVKAGNAWYAGWFKKFGFASSRPAFQGAVKQLQARRPVDLANAATAIAAELKAQQTPAALGATLKSYLHIPGDEETPAARTLRAVMSERLAEIKRDEYLTWFSPNERKWSPRPDGTISIPALAPPPDGEDIRMAWVRALERTDADRVGPYTLHGYGGNPIARGSGLYGTITVQPVHQLSVESVPGGFVSTYTIELAIAAPEIFKKEVDADPTLSLIKKFINGLSTFTRDIRKDRFELGDHGWWSPSLRERLAHPENDANE